MPGPRPEISYYRFTVRRTGGDTVLPCQTDDKMGRLLVGSCDGLNFDPQGPASGALHQSALGLVFSFLAVDRFRIVRRLGASCAAHDHSV